MPIQSVRANYGQFSCERDALAGMVSRLVGALDPQAIWLFGSRARGDARPDSDFDLMVLAKPGGGFGSDDYERVDAPLRDTGIGADVIPCDIEVFEASRGLKTSFVAQILEGGCLIYGRLPE
ncbi:MAG: nucleotidyltransferase family protein [Allorhizobium sp.]